MPQIKNTFTSWWAMNVMHIATMNIFLCVDIIFSPLGSLPRSGIAGPCANLVLYTETARLLAKVTVPLC